MNFIYWASLNNRRSLGKVQCPIERYLGVGFSTRRCANAYDTRRFTLNTARLALLRSPQPTPVASTGGTPARRWLPLKRGAKFLETPFLRGSPQAGGSSINVKLFLSEQYWVHSAQSVPVYTPFRRHLWCYNACAHYGSVKKFIRLRQQVVFRRSRQ